MQRPDERSLDRAAYWRQQGSVWIEGFIQRASGLPHLNYRLLVAHLVLQERAGG